MTRPIDRPYYPTFRPKNESITKSAAVSQSENSFYQLLATLQRKRKQQPDFSKKTERRPVEKTAEARMDRRGGWQRVETVSRQNFDRCGNGGNPKATDQNNEFK